MKFLRLGALFGSIVLLVATSITMINKRSELRSDQDGRVDAAAFIATQSALATDRSGARRRRRRRPRRRRATGTTRGHRAVG